MKRCLSFLFLGFLVLTSCQIGGRYSADILLEDDSKYHFTNKQLSQEEYTDVLDRLKKPASDVKYKFTIKRFGDVTYGLATSGEYASYSSTVDGVHKSIYSFTASIGRSKYEGSSHIEEIEQEEGLFHSESTVDYGTYGNSLDYGMAIEYAYDNAGSVRTTYYNPNIPITYPRPDETSKVKTPSQHFHSMNRFFHLYNGNEIVRFDGADTTTFDVFVVVGGTDYHFKDAPVFSHKLTSKYLVVKEKRKMPPFLRAVDENVVYGVCREIESHNYYINSTYYYNCETGQLDKTKCSFDTVSTGLEPGARLSGSYSLEHQNRSFEEIKSQHYDRFGKFRRFSGVTGYREERLAR